MKAIFSVVFVFISFALSAQEYERWNKADFEISNRSIESSWKEFGFTWQTESRFVLPEINFLELGTESQKKQLDMLAIISETNRKKFERKVDLGSPIPRLEKEKKVFEVTLEGRLRDERDVLNNPYFANPFLNNYNYRGFGVRRYSPYRFID